MEPFLEEKKNGAFPLLSLIPQEKIFLFLKTIAPYLTTGRYLATRRLSLLLWQIIVDKDVNMRSYIGSIRPPARLARLGRCLILDFQKRKCLNFFISRPPRRGKQGEQGKGRKRAKARRYKSWWWKFRKVGPIKCLYSSAGRKEERNEVRGRRARKGGESIRVDAPNKQNEIRLWPKKKQRYGYHDRSPSIKKNLSKLLWVRRAFKHPKYAGVVNKIAFMIRQNHQIEKYLLENGLIEGDSFKKPKLLKFFFPKGSRYNDPRGHLLTRTLPAVRPSLNSLVMQYLLNTKKKMNFDPILVLKNFVEPGAVETSTMKRSDAPGRSLDKRIRSCIAFFVESSTGEKESLALAEGKKRLTHFIRQANDLRFAGRRKSTISLFPFFGATFFFLRDGRRVYNLFYQNARRELLRKLRRKCWNLMGKDKVLNKVMQLIDKSIDLGGIRELIRGMELMIKIILKNRRIPYGYCSDLNEVQKMRSILSNRTKTNPLIESVKIRSVYQSASLLAQDISFQLKKKRRSFRSIFNQIVKKIPSVLRKRMIKGIRISCSGRLRGAEIARTECGKYGKTSSNVLDQKIDYAFAEVSTRYGIVGVKVWISYR